MAVRIDFTLSANKIFIFVFTIFLNNATNVRKTQKTLPNITILLWTSRHVKPFSHYNIGSNIFAERYCEFQNCYLTDNKTYLDVQNFDVVLFNAEDIKTKDLPQNRTRDQRYVLLTADVPPEGIQEYTEIFNMTWSYKLDSDIIWPKIIIREARGKIVGPKTRMRWKAQREQPLQLFVINKLRSKTKAAMYLVPHCLTVNHSNPLNDSDFANHMYISRLNKELRMHEHRVDKFSKCNESNNDECYTVSDNDSCFSAALPDVSDSRDCKSLQCPNKAVGKTCDALIESEYYFFLAFEKDIDEDLVGPHLLTALQHFAVPVVLGGADYSRFLPNNSYINAKGMTPKLLAETMLDLIHNPNKYEKMFSWRRQYMYYAPEVSPDTDPFCQFCALLNDKKKMKKISRHNDLISWYNNYSNGSFFRFDETGIQIIDMNNFEFTLNSNICKNLKALPVIGIVFSALHNFERRHAIRQTWGRNSEFIKVVFLLGKTDNQTISERIMKESKDHRDIVQGNFIDSRSNLTYKHIMGLLWTTNYCPIAENIVKTTDDIIVNIANLQEFLHKEFVKSVMACRLLENIGDTENDTSKIGEIEFEKEAYPLFCHGAFILYDAAVAPLLVEAADDEPYMHFDNVFVTGILREKLKYSNIQLPIVNITQLDMGYNLLKQKEKTLHKLNSFLFAYSNHLEQLNLYWDTEGYWQEKAKSSLS